MTPEEVEARIVAPIEVEMLGIPNQKILRSVSKYALTDITIDFEDGTDIYWARQQVARAPGNVMSDLPPSVSGGLAPITTPLGEMFMFTIEGGDLSLAERRTLLDWVIRPALRTLPGVADVNSWVAWCAALKWCPITLRWQARGITLDELQRRWKPITATMAPAVSSDGEEAAAGARRRRHQDSGRCARYRRQQRETACRCAWAMWRRCASAP